MRGIKWILLLILIIETSPMVLASRIVRIEGFELISGRSVSRAVHLIQNGAWEEARSVLEEVIARNPRNHAAIFDLGVAYEYSGDKSKAAEYYRLAIGLKLNRPYFRALARVQPGSSPQPELFSRLMPCRGICKKAVMYAEVGLWRSAFDIFAYLYRENPGDVRVCFDIAVTREALGDRSGALKYCRKAMAIKNDPRFADFMLYLKDTAKQSNNNNLTVTEMPTIGKEQIKEYNYISKNAVTLRRDPSEMAPMLDSLPRGARVGILNEMGDWIHVRTFKNQEGWVQKTELAPSPEAAWRVDPFAQSASDDFSEDPELSSPDTSETDSELVNRRMQVIDTGAEIALREKPSLLSDVIGHVRAGRKVYILSRSRGNWVEIRFRRGVAYILSEYLEEIVPKEPEKSGAKTTDVN